MLNIYAIENDCMIFIIYHFYSAQGVYKIKIGIKIKQIFLLALNVKVILMKLLDLILIDSIELQIFATEMREFIKMAED